MDIQARLHERYALEQRLRDAGFDCDGGGIGTDGQYDIFVYETRDDATAYATVLHSGADVTEYIASGGTRGGDHSTERKARVIKAALREVDHIFHG